MSDLYATYESMLRQVVIVTASIENMTPELAKQRFAAYTAKTLFSARMCLQKLLAGEDDIWHYMRKGEMNV